MNTIIKKIFIVNWFEIFIFLVYFMALSATELPQILKSMSPIFSLSVAKVAQLKLPIHQNFNLKFRR